MISKDTIMEDVRSRMGSKDNTGTWTYMTDAITVRDQFAMAALPSLIGITGNSKLFNVKLAYEYADLMCQQREKPMEE